MAIYRGIGGAGDSTTDATVTAVTQQAVNAAASATSAASSASTATTKAAAASASASSASTSATNAASSASAASTSATNALASQVAAAASETAAGASETAAAASESAAATSASNAASSASSASSSASAASSSATAAQNAQTAAEAAQVAAELALDSFDDIYLGAKSSAPTLDNDGNALQEGALYYDTVLEALRVYKNSAWATLADSGSGVLLASANLSDVADAATARSNLGIVTDLVGDTTPQLGGALDTNGNAINFGDGDKATFGDSEDLWLYHDGTTSYLYDRGTGNLRIITNSTVSIDGVSGGEFMATFVSNGAVSLYYDNSNKFQTTSTGINVNGNIAVSGTVDGRDVATDGTKLDGIEAGATADQTAQEIATAIDADATAETTLKAALGLGTAAYTAYTDYATAAQGALAASATQPGDNISTLTNDSGYLTGITGQSIKNLSDVYSTMAPTNGQLLTWDNVNSRWDAQDAPVSLPNQTGNAGKFLTTDGTNASWTTTIDGGTF